MKIVVAALFAVALALPASAQEKDGQTQGEKQDGDKKAPAKDGGAPVKKPVSKDGDGKGPVKGGGVEDPSLSVAEVDANGDGRISASELKAAWGRLYPKKDSGGSNDGGVKKPSNPDGAPGDKKDPPKDGGDVKKPVNKDAAPADKTGQKKEPSKDGNK